MTLLKANWNKANACRSPKSKLSNRAGISAGDCTVSQTDGAFA
jgi:hypothetical protein